MVASASSPTEKSIRQRVGVRAFERGARYFSSGRIHDARRAGNALKARCFGSHDHDYRVEVRLNGSKIVSGRCSCPVGGSGVCKHVAALLLNWRERPRDFEEVPGIETVLAERSPAELIALIRAMLDAEPALEDVLEAALPVASRNPEQTFEAVHRTITHALERLAEGGEPGPAAAAIEAHYQQLLARRDVGDLAGAAAVGRGVIAAVIDTYDINADMTGSVASAVNHVAGALVKCFAELPKSEPLRGTLLHDLLSLLRFDVCAVGAGLAESVPEAIAPHVTPGERREVLDWASENSPPPLPSDAAEAWQRECWGALIADLLGDELNDEAYLEHCREFGLDAARIARLLQLKRFEEALQAAAQLDEPQLPEIAELLLKHKRGKDAIRLMQCRAADSPAAAAWLTAYYEDRGAWDDALDWRRHEFEQSPDLVNYRAVRRAAQKAGRWPQVADDLLEIAGRTADPEDRLRILIEEERDADLLNELESAQRSGRKLGSSLLEEIATAIERRHPERSIDLYLEAAEQLIASRRSGNYATASDLLCRARRLYESVGRQQEWNRRIREIASRHSRRRALQQQLRRDRLLP